MRVVFLGGRKPGELALRTLEKTAHIAGVITQPTKMDPSWEAGVINEMAENRDWSLLEGRPDHSRFESFVRDAEPDLLWITDYTEIVPEVILDIPPQGAVNLHPGLLPKYRGRAPLNWAIINGETELGLTAHFANAEADAGSIIHQSSFTLSQEEDVGDALNKLYPLYPEVTETVLDYFLSGDVPRREQDESRATTYPARSPEDGRINWNQDAESIHNLVRALAEPYPGASTLVSGNKMIIWNAQIEALHSEAGQPGEVLENVNDENLLVACGRGILRIHDWEFKTRNEAPLEKGERLGTTPTGSDHEPTGRNPGAR